MAYVPVPNSGKPTSTFLLIDFFFFLLKSSVFFFFLNKNILKVYPIKSYIKILELWVLYNLLEILIDI